MKQIAGGALISFLLFLPYVVLFVLFIIFFCMAIFYKGLQKMLFFTIFISGVSAMFVLISPMGIAMDFTGILPVRLINTYGSLLIPKLITTVILGGYIVVFIAALKARNLRIVVYAWLVFLLFNIMDIAHNGYLYLTWVKPVEPKHLSSSADIILLHVRRSTRAHFLYGMIGPLLWVFVSAVCLLKIRMEVRIALAAAGKEPGPAEKNRR